MTLKIFPGISMIISAITVSGIYAATNFVFVHHSVGEAWLDQGELRSCLESTGLTVNDTTYGDNVPGSPSVPDKTPIGDYTDVRDWYYWFHNYFDGLLAWECASGEYNQIIMFKSCYPNSAIPEDGTAPGDPTNENASTWNYKAAYLSLTNTFAGHSNVLFIAVTAPPMRPGDGYNKDTAARGRTFDDWLKTDYQFAYRADTGLRNMVVFDLFDILATADTKPHGANALAPAYRTRDSHPNAKGDRAATGAFLPFLRNALAYWCTGIEGTNSYLKAVKARLKTSTGALKINAEVDLLGSTPGDARILLGTNIVQTFGASTWQSHGTTRISKVVAANGKKASLKVLNRREPRIILKAWVTNPGVRPFPITIDLGNGRTYFVDLLTTSKGVFP